MRRRVLIVCEGRLTEASYFNELRRSRRLTATVVIRHDNSDPLRVVRDAVERRDEAARQGSPFDDVWCVFDTEAPHPHPTIGAALVEAQRHGASIARSNPCFELWLLLHIRDIHGYLTTAAAVSQLAAEGVLSDSKQIAQREFMRLETGLDDACGRAKYLRDVHERDELVCPDDNPSSGVDALIAALIS